QLGGRSGVPLDPKDKLAEFKFEHYVEPYFHLTDAESALVDELFHTIYLDSRMTMFDILGFALYERLESLKEITSQFNEKITISQGMLSAYCLLFYVGLQRTATERIKTETFGAVNAYTERFVLLPDKFLKVIDRVFETLREEVKTARVPGRKPLVHQLEMLKAHKTKVLDQITKTIIPLRMLYAKLFRCKGYYHLFLRSVSSYQGYEALDLRNKAGRAVVKRYFDYVKSGFQTGVKERLLGTVYNFDDVMKKDMPFSELPTENEMLAFGTKIVRETRIAHHHYQVAKNEMEEALFHGMDYKTWLARRSQKSVSEKTPDEFREQLFNNLSLTQITQSFLSDILRLVEYRVYPRGTLTTESCAFRLIHNMHMHWQK
ncbi:MAG TPA: hypothetical protein VIJ14_10360, partial [Rhabdochlamydiaceae bacterium]